MQRLSNQRVFTLCCASFFCACAMLGAQEILDRKPLAAPRPAAEKEDAELKKGDELAEKEFPNGASLKTDPELERLLKRAEQFVEDGRYDLASVLWQKVLDESGDTLMTRDGRIYTSLAAEVERTLAKLPSDGLKLYRISADGEANAILASIKQGVDEEEALNKIVRRYFMSSLGDDAAYKLGCLALDRYDFVGASRMFQAILDQHPDPSIPRSEVLLRQAVASAKVGDKTVATQTLVALDTATGARPPHEAISAVKAFVSNIDKNSGTATALSRQWLMEYGNPSRTGHFQKLPKSAAEADLAELWSQEFDVLLPQVLSDPSMALRGRRGPAPVVMMGGLGGRVVYGQTQTQATGQESRSTLTQRWWKEGWFPTGRLLFDADEHGSRVYVKTATELTCWDANGQSSEPIWRTAWLNMYEPDGGTQMFTQMYNGQMMQEGPRSLAEIMHFGDRVHSAISISGDLIFNLEGKQVHRSGGKIEQDPPRSQPYGYGVVPRRTRRNWLAAYESRTGKARWYRSADDAEKEEGGKPATDIGFLGAPTPYGNLLLIPVTDGGAIWLYALARNDGKTVWKSYLCDEPPGGANPWSSVAVAVDGRDAYVGCGTGALFAVDAVSGTIRWATRYKRTEKPSTRMANVYGVQNRQLDFSECWSEDVVIPYGKLLVVMASDADRLFAIDRRTGEFAWDSPKVSTSYCVGVAGRALFVAGRDCIRKYDMPTGLLKSHRMLNTEPRQSDALSYGRGMVAEDAVYLPVKDSVLKLSLDNLADISQVGVSTVTGDPVGNLFSDGEKLWVTGASRISTLTNYDQRMAELAAKIAAGDATSQLIRMRMQNTRGRSEEAIADLEGAYQLLLAKDPLNAAQTLLDGMKELQLATQQPLTTLRLLRQAFVKDGRLVNIVAADSAENEGAARELLARRSELIYSALGTIRTKKVPDATGPVLALAPALEQDYLVRAAQKSLAASASAADAEALLAALHAASPEVVMVAADAAARLKTTGAKEAFTKLLANDNDKVKLAGASGLVNLGERAGLAPLVELLDSSHASVAHQASFVLRHATGQAIAFNTTSPEQSKKSLAQWKAWLEKEGATAKLTFPIPDGDLLLGRTLVCYYAHGKVIEFDENNKERWSKDIQGVWGGQGLPNGHRLLALYAMRKIVELDDNGKEVWSLDNLPGSPFNARRLSNGNTLVACSDSKRVVEYNADKKEVWSLTAEGRPMDAVRLENGNTLVALSASGRIVEYASGDKGELKEVWSCEGLPGAMSVERLENGNMLVACMNGGSNNAGMVVEVDSQKNHVWKFETVRNPYDAQRLPNGNTLVTDNQRVVEVDANKNVVWKQERNGSSSAHRF